MTDRLEIKAALAVSDAGEITGLAWPCGSPDRVGDTIEKGAFTGAANLPMLFSHDHSQVIGVWNEITETPSGLEVNPRLFWNWNNLQPLCARCHNSTKQRIERGNT